MEEAIAERLTEKLGSLVKYVYTAAELAQVEEESQKTPACLVSFNGYAPVTPQGGAQGKIQLVEKSWLVVVHARSARGTRTQQGAKDECSAIIEGVMAALLGWRPPIEGEMPLALSAAPGAAFTDAGFAYYPIVFTNRRTYRGTD